jgi:hypothetical protein
MNHAAISGDIIAYTSLSDSDKILIESEIVSLFKLLKRKLNVYGRMIKGDYIECYIPNPADSLRVALIIKSYIKSFSLESSQLNNRVAAYKTYVLRLAIGIGEINRFEPRKGIIDGEAIYFSGRVIDENKSTSDKKRIVIKRTLFFKSKNEEINNTIDPLLGLIEVLLSKATAKHNKVLYLKLMGNQEDDIAKKLNIYQSTVNEHSTSLGWNAIEKALLFFEKLINSKYNNI